MNAMETDQLLVGTRVIFRHVGGLIVSEPDLGDLSIEVIFDGDRSITRVGLSGLELESNQELLKLRAELKSVSLQRKALETELQHAYVQKMDRVKRELTLKAMISQLEKDQVTKIVGKLSTQGLNLEQLESMKLQVQALIYCAKKKKDEAT